MHRRHTGTPPFDRLLRIFLRFKWRAIACFFGIILLAILGLVLCPRKYTSEAKLLVRLGRENVALDPTASMGKIISLNASREAEMNSVIEALRSRTVLERVLDTVGPEVKITTLSHRDKVLERLAGDIEIWSPKNSSVVCLNCEASSAKRAQDIVQTLTAVYRDEHMRVNRTQGSYEFFDEQAQLLKQDLDKAYEQLRDAKNRHGVVSLSGRRVALQQQLSELDIQQHETHVALLTSEEKIRATQKGLAELPAALIHQLVGGAPNDGLSAMRQQFYELQTREEGLRAQFTDQHPLVIAIRQQVEEAERILEAETPRRQDGSAAVLLTERANVQALQAKVAALQDQQQQLQQQLRELNAQELEITELERQVRILDESYLAYAKSLEQARIDQALTSEGISNISIIQPATYVAKPSSPRKALTLLLSLLIAGIGAVGVVLVSDHLDQLLVHPDDVEQVLQMPTLVSIPLVSSTCPKY